MLSYQVTPAAGRTIAFAERGAGVYHLIGTALARRGEIAFTPASGQARDREIVALISQDGAPAGQAVVGSYVAAEAARVAAPRGLSVHRAGTRLLVSWRPVPGAWRYATTISAGAYRRLLLSTVPHVTFIGVSGITKGSVQVVAIPANGQDGAAAIVLLKPPRSGTARR